MRRHPGCQGTVLAVPPLILDPRQSGRLPTSVVTSEAQPVAWSARGQDVSWLRPSPCGITDAS